MKEILPIIIYDNPILREVSKDVPKDYDIKGLIEKMRSTLETTGTGIGLAANQVRIPLRAFLGPNHEAFINWKVIEHKGSKTRRKEGCLSIPGVFAYVQRPQKIRIKYYD